MLNPLSVLKHPVLLSLYFISSLAHAQNFSSAATDATGGAGRAAVDAGDVNYLNPAGLVHLRGRYVYSTFSKEDLSLSLSEASREVVVPASLSYFQRKVTDAANRKVQWQDTRLSLADFVTNKFSMGVTGILSSVKIDGQGYNQTNGNLGFFYTPIDTVGIAYVFYNVFGVNEDVPEEVRLEPAMAVAMNYIYKGFLRFRLDIESAKNNNFGKPAYMTGIESLLNQWVIFRVGYKNDILASQELFTVGAGFSGPVFGLNYAYQGSIKGVDFDRHSIDLLFSF
ncbi:hypothetical protein [Bdellovibrio sp. HCB337]|uniref:hypothetical protein n=1 Tax=Bdellovibrio sp. HCB337 TaxID=3394358 RepID=UPI0039A74217